jgi:hypothetical protein
MLSDRLRGDEVALTERAMRVLDEIEWARPIVRRLVDAGGLTRAENKSRMFEVRVAYELHRAGIIPRYEQPTGVGGMSVDFFVPGDPSWLIEVVSLGKTVGMQRATTTHGLVTVLSVGDNPDDPLQTEAGELLTTQAKIAEKARKFPVPMKAWHVILVDTRAYLDNGADPGDAHEMLYGPHGLPLGVAHSWQNQPVLGLMDPRVPLAAAPLVRERIHFVGFVAERRYEENEIRAVGYYVPNSHLFAGQDAARAAFRRYPLRPTTPNIDQRE